MIPSISCCFPVQALAGAPEKGDAMNRFKIAVVVLLTAGGGSYARAQPPDTTGAGQYTAFVDSGGRRIQIVRNANDCAPFLAEAVWGQGTSTAGPTGYRCFRTDN